MSKTVSFVVRDELADWVEQRAEERMNSISAVCRDMVVAEYRREQNESVDDTSKSGQTPVGQPLAVECDTQAAADYIRHEEVSQHLAEADDARRKLVVIAGTTPTETVARLAMLGKVRVSRYTADSEV